MATLTETQIHGATARMDIHQVVKALNDVLGSTLVAALTGSKDRKQPIRWAKPNGPKPSTDFTRRLQLAHRLWTSLEQAEGEHIARGWFIGGNPLLDEDTPLTAIREDRAKEVTAAAASFIEGAGGA
ncbi:hypothetical protein [[Arthrobacter] sp. ATCC 21022]|uniref:hypothetical protein n=1 Tax=[Arthrobacter] sp. ATCC 21022 TaxID=1771959 RepID=UPI00074D296E|nr:hypothetical protein AUT26_18810 [Arthrobacter sp. ATCC 21022]KUR62719.1 hypothetical protein JM67_20145 [Arthrobacter sp. ATCC 21022]